MINCNFAESSWPVLLVLRLFFEAAAGSLICGYLNVMKTMKQE